MCICNTGIEDDNAKCTLHLPLCIPTRSYLLGRLSCIPQLGIGSVLHIMLLQSSTKFSATDNRMILKNFKDMYYAQSECSEVSFFFCFAPFYVPDLLPYRCCLNCAYFPVCMVIINIVKGRSWPQPDDAMSISYLLCSFHHCLDARCNT